MLTESAIFQAPLLGMLREFLLNLVPYGIV
jgi:hypothetical protein